MLLVVANSPSRKFSIEVVLTISSLLRAGKSFFVNLRLKSQGIETGLLVCDYEGKWVFLVVTAWKHDGKETPNELKEDDRALGIKEEMKIDAVEFVTVTVANHDLSD